MNLNENDEYIKVWSEHETQQIEMLVSWVVTDFWHMSFLVSYFLMEIKSILNFKKISFHLDVVMNHVDIHI